MKYFISKHCQKRPSWVYAQCWDDKGYNILKKDHIV